ncbi:MAG: 50S ribosomal protein L30 [Anaerolineae bacterium]|nr:50S ribosomal protein L30 [Anaerolineae bacterium]
MAKYLRVTYAKSSIGNLERHKETIRSLGFRKLGQTLEIPDTPPLRGMVQSVIHLVRVEEFEKNDAPMGAEVPSVGGRS